MVEIMGNDAVNSSLHVKKNWIGLFETSKQAKKFYSGLVLCVTSLFQS